MIAGFCLFFLFTHDKNEKHFLFKSPLSAAWFLGPHRRKKNSRSFKRKVYGVKGRRSKRNINSFWLSLKFDANHSIEKVVCDLEKFVLCTGLFRIHPNKPENKIHLDSSELHTAKFHLMKF